MANRFLYLPSLRFSNTMQILSYNTVAARPRAIDVSRTLLIPENSIERTRMFFRKTRQHISIRALREWQEYEEAVKDKDLARALSLLRDISVKLQDSSLESTAPLNVGGGGGFGSFELQRDWEVLDACLNADDMRLVGSAYVFLKDRGRLPSFGKCRNIGKSILNFDRYS